MHERCQMPIRRPDRWSLVNIDLPMANGTMAIPNPFPIQLPFIHSYLSVRREFLGVDISGRQIKRSGPPFLSKGVGRLRGLITSQICVSRCSSLLFSLILPETTFEPIKLGAEMRIRWQYGNVIPMSPSHKCRTPLIMSLTIVRIAALYHK
jgi:hypothetical protein